MKRVDKPWGYEEIWAHTPDYVGKIIRINKGHRLSYQFHRIKQETIRLLEGEMEFEVEHTPKGEGVRRSIKLTPGDTYHIPAGTKHRMIAVQDCLILEVSTPELDDVVRLEDDYGRASDGGKRSGIV